ncbi:MAG: DUF86 domain-containing protein [Proteobacteria bacterium]|nr:DUF86 domain-containing protein [Pseudomonadota bacterium]
MARAVRPSLYDVLAAIDGIEGAIAGKTFDEFKDNWLLRHAIQRGVEIISEACRRIPEPLRQIQPDIPWREIMGIGNVLRHDYESVSDEIIWNVARNRLSSLRQAITAIEATLPEDG